MGLVYSLVKNMQPDGLKILDDPASCPKTLPNYSPCIQFLHWYSPNESCWRKFLEEAYFLANLLHSSVSTNIFLAKINQLLQTNWFPYVKSQLLFSSTHSSQPPSAPIFVSSEDLANFFLEKGDKMCLISFSDFFFPSHPFIFLQCWGWGSFSFCSSLTPWSGLESPILSP